MLLVGRSPGRVTACDCDEKLGDTSPVMRCWRLSRACERWLSSSSRGAWLSSQHRTAPHSVCNSISGISVPFLILTVHTYGMQAQHSQIQNIHKSWELWEKLRIASALPFKGSLSWLFYSSFLFWIHTVSLLNSLKWMLHSCASVCVLSSVLTVCPAFFWVDTVVFPDFLGF